MMDILSAKNRKFKWIFSFFLINHILSGLVPNLNAQNYDISFQRISLEQGLSQSIVESIVQDRKGFMWFGTEDGLNRYDGYGFTVIKNDPNDINSLSYNQVLTVYEDKLGMIWIGTFNGGLNKYDPETKKFKRFQHDPHNPASLSNDIVRSIYEDKSGVLWIGTERGLNRLVPANSPGDSIKFVRYFNEAGNSNSLCSNRVRAIYEDESSLLWVGTDRGLSQLIPGKTEVTPPTFIHYRNDPNEANSLSNDNVRTIYKDRTGTLWIGTDGGLNKVIQTQIGDNRGESEVRFVRYLHDPNNLSSLSHNEVYAIFEDSKGMFWIGTNGGGLNLFDRKKDTFTHYLNNPRDPNSLSYNEIRCIYEDSSGVLWIGTYGGSICKSDQAKKQFVHYKTDQDNPNSLNEDIVWCIYEDGDGILWIGTNGGGLNKFDRKKKLFTHYLSDPDDPKSLSSNIVRLVLEDHSGVLWIGTHGGGLNKFDREKGQFTSFQHDPGNPRSLSHNDLRALYEDRSGTLWIGTRGGGVNKLVPGKGEGIPPTFVHYRHDLNNPQSISSDFIRVIFEDKSGVMWIGTLGSGINKFDRETDTFTHYRANSLLPNCLSNDYIFSIYEDKGGIIWIGTWGGGLNRFDRASGKFKYYTEKDGLANNAVYGILEDNQGNLWLSTNDGISKFNPRTETFRNFGVRDGLQSQEFNGGSYFKSSAGEMFFGGINGFNAFYPEKIKNNQHVPPIVITSFQKLNKEMSFEKPIWEVKTLELSYKDYVFSIEFAALDFTAPEMNSYAYKMEGLDEDWIYTDVEKRFANYTTLSPGKYVFRVKGSNNDGIWNEEGTSIKIIITPPFWKTWWFTLLIIFVVLSLIFLWYRLSLKTVRMRTELQAAHDAQMSIMPQFDPQIQGFDISGFCIPANEVGGDFFDYVWLDKEKNRFGIYVGDVSGKAMTAAMTAVMSSGMINTEARESRSVEETMTRVNQSLYLKTKKEVFTAVCFASIDLIKKEFVFTNAGLVEPLLISDGSVKYINAKGVTYPLGLIQDNVYQKKILQLKPGDIIILLTDGIVEAQNNAREFYGEERLKELLQNMSTSTLSACNIKQLIVEDVSRFSGTAPQHDDMTLVVLKIDK